MLADNKMIDFLKNIYFFKSMPDNTLHKILKLCSRREYKIGEILCLEDTPGDSFFIVLEGNLAIWKRYGKKDAVFLGTSGQGKPIGEMALIDNCDRSATVIAQTFVEVLVLKSDDFSQFLLTDTALCLSLLKAVTTMVRHSNEAHIADLDRQNKELAKANFDLKEAQDELVKRERLYIIGKFSSIIMHDIRNPLSALKSRIELLKINHQDPSYFNHAIKNIDTDITRMEIIAGEFLDYGRGEIRLQLSICDVSVLLERFVDIMRLKTDQSNISIDILNSVEKPVILDEERILRVLVNAGDNACKAMVRGGKCIIRSYSQQSFLFFEIEDTGVGMSEDVLSHIFEPFYSASSGGVGLGMMIIKNIIDAHSGEVIVSSIVGKGTIVKIMIPILQN